MRLETALHLFMPVLAGEALRPTGELDLPGRAVATGDAASNRFRELALYAVNTAVVRVTPTQENCDFFPPLDIGEVIERSGELTDRVSRRAARPIVYVTALVCLRSQMIVAATAGRDTHSDAVRSLPIPDHSLTFFGAVDVAPLVLLERGGAERHWIADTATRKAGRLIKTFDERAGDGLVELRLPPAVREGPVTHHVARIFEHQRQGATRRLALTSLRDPKEYPLPGLVAVHSERWASGMGSVPATPLVGGTVLSADDPATVHDRLWELLWAYNMLRHVLLECAAELGVEPQSLSLVRAIERAGKEAITAAVRTGSMEPLASLRADAASLIEEPRSTVNIVLRQLAF